MSSDEALSCLVLSDGRRGIENQALGLAEACAALRPLNFQTHHLKPKKLIAALPPKAQLGLNGFDLPACDIAIGCGRQAMAPLLWLKRNRPEVFTVYVQDPRQKPSRFDLVVAPEHDRLSGENVITTIGSPNRITEDRLIGETLNFAKGLAILPMPRAALLIGGTSKTHKLTPKNHARHLDHAKDLLNAGYSLLITSSRRTPEFAKQSWRDFADSYPQIWLYEGEGPNPYFAFLGGAGIILVTEDSTNMLTEACSTGKPVYRLAMTGKPGKFSILYQALEERCGVTRYAGQTEHLDYEPLDETHRAAQAILAQYDDTSD